MIHTHRTLLAIILAAAMGAAHATPTDEAMPDVFVPAAKVDSGLGSLPDCSLWAEPWLHAMPAEKVDSGLGALPDVSRLVEVWLYAYPAESVDNGLGEVALQIAAERATPSAR